MRLDDGEDAGAQRGLGLEYVQGGAVRPELRQHTRRPDLQPDLRHQHRPVERVRHVRLEHAKAASIAQEHAIVAAAFACKAAKKSDPAAFKAKYKTFGRCVATLAAKSK